jgi:hypothetical protein
MFDELHSDDFVEIIQEGLGELIWCMNLMFLWKEEWCLFKE